MRLSPSPAAQFQATKTRAVLGVQLFFQAVLAILALWIALITALVWRQVGTYLPQLDHVYFGRWILGETPLLNRFTWWIGIRFNGVQLRLDAASAWLAGPELYRHTFYQAFYHAATNGWGLAIELVPLSLVAALIGWRLGQNPAGGEHLRGLQLLTPKEHNRQLHGGALKRLIHGQPTRLLLGKTIIPHSYECEHFLITGNPGSGKSTTIRAILRQIASRFHAAILGTATNAIKTFVHLPKRNKSERTWSACQWARERRGWIFLPARDDLNEAIRTVQGLWLDTVIRWLMSAEIGRGQTWVMADELASLGHQPQIEKLLTRGRKRGLAVAIGLQNVSQLQALYGREGCITLTSSPSTKIILRVDETETAKWASELIGSREIERLTMTQLAGLSTYREGINLSPHRTIEPLVLADEIKLLRPFTGYLCLAGHHRTTVRIPELHLTRYHQAFIPRAADKPPAPPVAQLSEPEIAAHITARDAYSTEL